MLLMKTTLRRKSKRSKQDKMQKQVDQHAADPDTAADEKKRKKRNDKWGKRCKQR